MARRYEYGFWIKDESHKHIEVHCFGYHLGTPAKGAEWTMEKDPEIDRSEANFIQQLKKADNVITIGFDADHTKEEWFPKLNKGRMLDVLILKIMSRDYDPEKERRLSLFRVQIMSATTTPETKTGYAKPFLQLHCKVNGSVWKDD